MSTWKKVPAELAARFDAALPVVADVQRRTMFGCPAAFVNGNLFAGLHEDRLMVRLPAQAKAWPCVLMGRTMKEYALFPDALEMADRDLAGWVAQAYAFTRTLPVKPAKTAPKTRPGGSKPRPKQGTSA
ncbi:MAG: TfoX/Sxy family protein [Burkholderiaceae bacterium]|nr:TfoX/Sxy family protein [Burkholderiaceae bacterium]